MERTSIITVLLISESENYPLLTLVNGLPDANSMVDYFTAVPLVLEKADLKESTQDSDQGQLLDIAIRANIHRDSDFYKNFSNKKVLCYLETSNGEKHFFGTDKSPLSFSYSRDSGAANGDARETTLELNQRIALV